MEEIEKLSDLTVWIHSCSKTRTKTAVTTAISILWTSELIHFPSKIIVVQLTFANDAILAQSTHVFIPSISDGPSEESFASKTRKNSVVNLRYTVLLLRLIIDSLKYLGYKAELRWLNERDATYSYRISTVASQWKHKKWWNWREESVTFNALSPHTAHLSSAREADGLIWSIRWKRTLNYVEEQEVKVKNHDCLNEKVHELEETKGRMRVGSTLSSQINSANEVKEGERTNLQLTSDQIKRTRERLRVMTHVFEWSAEKRWWSTRAEYCYGMSWKEERRKSKWGGGGRERGGKCKSTGWSTGCSEDRRDQDLKLMRPEIGYMIHVFAILLSNIFNLSQTQFVFLS